MQNQSYWPRIGCDNSSMVKILMTIQANLVPRHKFTRIVIVKIFANENYYHSHFLAANFDFTSFFTLAFWGCTLFSQLGCFCIDRKYCTVPLILQHVGAA